MPIRILIADDNQVARGRLRETLDGHEGWQVCAETENGRQAIEKARDLKPDLIVLDVVMPMLDGLRATREIRRILPGVPILIYTLHDADVVCLEAKKAGATRVVSKLEHVSSLITALEQLIEDRAAPAAAAASAAASALPLPLDAANVSTPQAQVPLPDAAPPNPPDPDPSSKPN
jgi:DNA-binding NarL/FixJ family response regulator